MLPDKNSGRFIRRQYSLKVGLPYYFYALDRRQNTVINLIIAEPMLQKQRYRRLIRRAHDAWRGAAFPCAVHSKLQAGGLFIVRRFKGHVLHVPEIKTLEG